LTATDVQELFFAGGHAIIEALDDPAVEAAWDRPSVLEEQLVSSVAGHLARSGIWVVDEYLAAGGASGRPDFESAGAYFAAVAAGASSEVKRAVRDRGAGVAALGRAEILRRSHESLSRLKTDLVPLPAAHLMTVFQGKVIGLSDYLVTRIVEQAVHLDDLARSAGRDPWPLPIEHLELTFSVATDIACRARGPHATIRALYRRGFADGVFPVL
jgi:Mycothiol maleylpyruvate isomerase N-terminal domain